MAHISDVLKKVTHLEFDPDVAYDNLLLKFREEFNKKWENVLPSPETGLEGYTELMITLGAGDFGHVVLVKKNQSYNAVKIFVKDVIVQSILVAHAHTEKRVLASTRFPFVMNLEFSAKDFDNLYLGMPYLSGGDLFAHQRTVRKFDENQARFYAAQVLMGLEYLHFLQLLYRDLKPENIIIGGNGYIKISGLGFAKKVETRTFSLCGTPEYMAPEVIKSKPYGPSVDWWSFGVLVYELVAGNSPFSRHNHDVMSMYSKICKANFKTPVYFSEPLKDLVERLLQVETSKRLGNLRHGVSDIREHSWFESVNWYSLLNQQIAAPLMPELISYSTIENFSKSNNHRDATRKTKSETNRHADLFLEF